MGRRYKMVCDVRGSPAFKAWDTIRSAGNRGVYVCSEWHKLSGFAPYYMENNPNGDLVLSLRAVKYRNGEFKKELCKFITKELSGFLRGLEKKNKHGKSNNLLVGVYMRGDAFNSCSSVEYHTVHLGEHDTEIEAHKEWVKFKLDRLADIDSPHTDLAEKILRGIADDRN